MKSMRIILIVVALLALAGVILLTKVPIFNWDDSTIFLPEDDEPFGCKFFDEMAEATLPNGYSYFDGNPREMLEGKDTLSLLFMLEYMYVEAEMEELLASFVKKGNKLMVVTGSNSFWDEDPDESLFPFEVNNYSYFSTERLRDGLLGKIPPSRLIMDKDTIKVSDALASSFVNSMITDYKVHSYIGLVDDDEAGTNVKRVASLSYRYGKGRVYVVANPLLFTNYGVLHRNIARYIGAQLELIADHPVVRLSYGTARGEKLNGDYYSEEDDNTMAPLSYFLSRQPLRWATYTLLAGVCVFMLFTARRRQRVIPTVEAPKNKNLEFLMLLGTIYCKNHDNADMLRKKYLYFKEDLRRRQIADLDDHANHQGNVRILAQRTGLEEKFVEETLNELRKYTDPDVSVINNAKLMGCVQNIDKITNNL